MINKSIAIKLNVTHRIKRCFGRGGRGMPGVFVALRFLDLALTKEVYVVTLGRKLQALFRLLSRVSTAIYRLGY